MASAHLSAKIVSRGSGHSSVAAAAYNAREGLEDRRTGETHDYTRHNSKCLFQGVYAPKGAPEWAQDRGQLWNHVEAFEKRRNSQLAQSIDMALPHELTLEQNRYLLQDWVKENVTRKGLIADVAIHAPDRRGDSRNIHAHVLIVLRKLDGSEFTRAKERFDTLGEKQAAQKADLVAMRESWEKLTNRHLERHGHEARIDMGRKQDGEATLHMGRRATAQERRGSATEIGQLNREIIAANENRDRLRDHVRNQVQQGKQRDAETRQQIREDLAEHRRQHQPLRADGPEKARREAEQELAAERATRKPDRSQEPPERPRNPNARPGQDAARAAGRGAATLGTGAGKVAGGAMGIVGGLLGAVSGVLDAATRPATPAKGRPPTRLDEIEARARAKAAENAKRPPPEREKEREQDNTRSRFETAPATRLLAVVAGGNLDWIAEAKRRLIAYSNRTGASVLVQLEELDAIIFRALHGPRQPG